MSFESCHIKYDLSRKQRLTAHLGLWGPYFGGVILMFGVLILAIALSFSVSPWCLLLSIIPWLVVGGFMRGLLNVILVPVQRMDIIIDETGFGFMSRGQRFWNFLDGIISIKKYNKDVWTIVHHNGTVFNIPVGMIEQRCIDHMQSMADKGKTHEGVQTKVERGRRIMQIEAEEREEKRKSKKESIPKS